MKAFIKHLMFLSFFLGMGLSPLLAQSELDKFKTEEEIEAERSAMSWHEKIIKDATYYFNVTYKACEDFYNENVATLLGIAQEANVFDKAEKAVVERNVAAENRMKDIQEKTGLKGETTDMQQVIDKKELHYEVKEFNEIKDEIKK